MNILQWMNTPEDIIQGAYDYIFVIFLGIPVTYIYNMLAGIIRSLGDSKTHWKVDGDLTIRGVTRPVTVDLEFLGGAIDPWGNQRIGFSGVVPEVNREDWGLTWNTPLETGGFLLSKSVRLEIEAELIKKS